MDLIKKKACAGVEWTRVAQDKIVVKVKVKLSLYEP
jgi:peptidyl-tRNA hydrolase